MVPQKGKSRGKCVIFLWLVSIIPWTECVSNLEPHWDLQPPPVWFPVANNQVIQGYTRAQILWSQLMISWLLAVRGHPGTSSNSSTVPEPADNPLIIGHPAFNLPLQEGAQDSDLDLMSSPKVISPNIHVWHARRYYCLDYRSALIMLLNECLSVARAIVHSLACPFLPGCKSPASSI